MSAGDIIIRGWFGGSPAYKEIRAPVVSYEPTTDTLGVIVRKRLTRTIVCASKDVKTVLQGLSVDNATITAVVISSAGASDTLSYGGGWKLMQVGSTPMGNALTELRLEYEKEVATAFEFSLPTGLTLTESSGTAVWKYNTHTIETWDSGKGATTTGVRVIEVGGDVGAPAVPSYWTWPSLVADDGIGRFFYMPPFTSEIQFVVDDVVVFRFAVKDTDFPEYMATGRVRLWDADEPAGGDYTVLTLNGYKSINKSLRWDTSTANHVKLIYWDRIVRDWDVTGLTEPE